jgi:alpha/beta superfamily hydrolase
MIPFSEFFVSNEHPMYVQRWGPNTSSRRVVLIHGGVHTGVCWTTRPDGQSGWARYLAERGWTTFVVDWPGVGRSAGTGTLLQSTAEHVVTALVELVRDIGPTLLVGHSFGGAIAAKVMDVRRSRSLALSLSHQHRMEISLATDRRSLPIALLLSMKMRCDDFSATHQTFQKARSISIGVRFAQ